MLKGSDLLVIALYNELIKAYRKQGNLSAMRQCVRHKVKFRNQHYYKRFNSL